MLLSYVPTPEGWAALEQATREAAWRRTDVVVVNVAPGSNAADVTFADQKELDAVGARLAEHDIPHTIDHVLDASDVADAVLSAADRHGVELIVVGLRRRSAVGKALLGSNAQRIILGAQCPVLSVRP
ncbi:MAG: universal stress protein [Jatrophihabitantaceae bacterium]